MVLFMFYDGSVAEVEDCADVIHLPGCLVCVDKLGASLASFEDGEILGYTLDPASISNLKAGDQANVSFEPHPPVRLRRRRRPL